MPNKSSQKFLFNHLNSFQENRSLQQGVNTLYPLNIMHQTKILQFCLDCEGEQKCAFWVCFAKIHNSHNTIRKQKGTRRSENQIILSDRAAGLKEAPSTKKVDLVAVSGQAASWAVPSDDQSRVSLPYSPSPHNADRSESRRRLRLF